MNYQSDFYHKLQSSFRIPYLNSFRKHKVSEEPLLIEELFSIEQLSRHAESVANQHQVTDKRGPDLLLPRLEENEQMLNQTYQLITSTVQEKQRITPAGEWLLDNFYLIEENISISRRHLPKSYSRELPRLSSGASLGFPRVYDIALELIAHVDGFVDAENLSVFIAGYQKITTLKLGELWAIPIMLRLALIENLRRVSTRLRLVDQDRKQADYWVTQMIEIAEKDPKNLVLVMAEMAQENPDLSSSFVSEFSSRLQGRGTTLVLPLTWLSQRLAEQGLTIDQIYHEESQKQAANQVSVSNSISSLRFLGTMDWRGFVETMSAVEQTLRAEPADVYNDMDFETRDQYRHVIEDLAKHSRYAEIDIARQVVSLAQANFKRAGKNDRTAHIGYFLIDQGLFALGGLEQVIQVRKSLYDKLRKIGRRYPLFFYLGLISLIILIITANILLQSYLFGITGWKLSLVGIILILSVSHFAVTIVNWLSTIYIKPKHLPKLDFSDGIPPDLKTLVVVPTLLTSPENIKLLLEGLEVRYLANRDTNLFFCLLTDFVDALQETMPEDESLLNLAKEGIVDLQHKYLDDRDDIFFLLHRTRKWNNREKKWMGYERKRGKLTELNVFLRSRCQTDCFSTAVGKISSLMGIKYVITLDTDTQLPRDTARKLVGTMAHPLNRPVYDPRLRRITTGYAILQPRGEVYIPATGISRYLNIFGGEPGIDPYTREVSDVYQDLFYEGSYVGKGIYEIDMFEQVLSGRFPDNLILSHDLIESSYARSALVNDIQIYEDFPTSYITDISRRHRWIRGDWQILYWLFPHVPIYEKRYTRNPISWLSRWKIFDNLRRSLIPFSLLFLLIFGWLALPQPWFWTWIAFGIVLLPPVIISLVELSQKPKELPIGIHLRGNIRNIIRHFSQGILTLILLPFEAYYNLDAIFRSLFRMVISKHNLLEWTSYSESRHKSVNTISQFYRFMLVSPGIGLGLLITLFLYRIPAFPTADLLIFVWIISPGIAWWMSQPIRKYQDILSEKELNDLRLISRKIWRYFETFVTSEDHWLPPDNYQESPPVGIAHRTSPTNIGLYLLSTLAAYDFGYLTSHKFIDRITNTYTTMANLERYHGHFYNWYDTRTTQALPPQYISTVDSGNLAGHLLILHAGLLELINHHILPNKWYFGLTDTMKLLNNSIMKAESALKKKPENNQTLPALKKLIAHSSELLETPPVSTLSERYAFIQRLVNAIDELNRNPIVQSDDDIQWWTNAMTEQCQDLLNELDTLTPWLKINPPDNNWGMKLSAPILNDSPTLAEIAQVDSTLIPLIEQEISGLSNPTDSESTERITWLTNLRDNLKTAGAIAAERIKTINHLAEQTLDFAQFEFGFLYDKSSSLLAIGYNVPAHKRDPSYYDLLASESRLCSFIGIACGALPQEHWFALSRLLTATSGEPILLSWGGSMFEYLMPLLIMPNYENTLLDQTYKSVLKRQIDYAQGHGVPWGISESGYNTMDAMQNYQYRAFGVPGLGFKRGLTEDLVVAPYASILGLMVSPEKSYKNLIRLSEAGFEGRYGFYEAIDYTTSRLTRGQDYAIVRSFMSHHQGMSFLAIAYLVQNRLMQRRFQRNPSFLATELLLQERIPKSAPFTPHATEVAELHKVMGEQPALMRVVKYPHTPIPEVHLLSNGRYQVMVTNTGAGYSRWKDIAVTRWREDATQDNWGSFCYLRDMYSGEFWSTGYQPTLKISKSYESIFLQARAEFRREDFGIDSHTEISVSPEDDLELRRVTITNRSRTTRVIELTSYTEVVLVPPAAELTHPVFNNLFIQTELIEPMHAILCYRRPRSSQEHIPWMFHLMNLHGIEQGEASYETDRKKFIGRGNSPVNPVSLTQGTRLSNSAGAVLDPIAAIRRVIKLEPEEAATIDIITGISETRDQAILLINKYQDRHFADRVFDIAWSHSQVVLQHLNVTESEVQVYAHLSSSVIYANAFHRADANILAKNQRGQSGLWGYSVSGDYPIILLRIGSIANINLVKQLIQAHAYWRIKGLIVDLVIWNEDFSGYRQDLQKQIMELITTGPEAQSLDKPGGIYVRFAEQIPDEDKILFQTVSRIVISDRNGSLSEQLDRRVSIRSTIRPLVLGKSYLKELPTTAELPKRELLYFNGVGGFTPDGHEYVMLLTPGQITPSPWVNVIANPNFGTVVSAGGSSYTWNENAHEFRLTPWYNDPVSEPSGEAFYIRDEATGQFWSPTPYPAKGTTPYVSRHGFGYSVFEHWEKQINSELTIYVAVDAPVKFAVLKLRNDSRRPRQLSVTGYFEWVLAELRHKSLMHIVTELDPETEAIFARNVYNTEFPNRVAFLDVNQPARSYTGDRMDFIGRNGTLAEPVSMTQIRLSNKVGAGLDPCAALQIQIQLAEGQEKEIVFMLGVGQNADEARTLIQRYRGSEPSQRALEAVWNYWNNILGNVYIETADKTLDILTNGWLLYQTISSRLFGRSGFYQSGGAYGFRDQLQDSLALFHAAPQLVREHLLRCAAHQFREGDVQHWWHPPTNRGVRSRCSDDYLWLPFVSSRYIAALGDTGILDEPINFIEGRPLNPGEESYYDLPVKSAETGTVYDHCVRAIKYGLKFGEHGLPLIGGGDWNDGFNLVGELGKGESVWLAFFLYTVLVEFAPIARIKNDPEFAARCLQEAKQLAENIDTHGWDAQWYLRAYFDNGNPLGSEKNLECKIDSLPQSWAVLSGAGKPERTMMAMNAVDANLIDRQNRLIKLFTPPFDTLELLPGYIKGYVPGVRENGGQYTHAAIWAIMAYAAMGDRKRAWELFRLINPLNHGRNQEEIEIYQVEPYVVAADVYAVPPHTGRGGWTWYTGSAGWMYQLIIEWLIGLKLDIDKLRFKPCLPEDWNSFKLHYRYRGTFYHITINQDVDSTRRERPGNQVIRVIQDGTEQPDMMVHLADDRKEHQVEVFIL